MTEEAAVVAVSEQGCVTVKDASRCTVIRDTPVHTATTVEVLFRVIQKDKAVSVISVGQQGPRGLRPEHQWDGTKLRFQNPDGTWGYWVDIMPDLVDLVAVFQNALI